MNTAKILSYIRDVPDFPKEGIIFKDIMPALREPAIFKQIIDDLSKLIENTDFDYIVAIESRGFLLGAALAYNLNKGIVAVRKKNKLPAKVYSENYGLEYGSDVLEIQQDALAPGKKALIVDDVLATGGTVKATCRLVERCGAQVAGSLFLIELSALSQNSNIAIPVFSLLKI